MKTYLDVVNETAEYYKTNPFGYDSETLRCVYFGRHEEMCAVGRCLNEPELLFGSTKDSETVISGKLGGGLKPEYAHLNNIDFWGLLQFWHDRNAQGDPNEKYLQSVRAKAIKLDAKTKEG